MYLYLIDFSSEGSVYWRRNACSYQSLKKTASKLKLLPKIIVRGPTVANLSSSFSYLIVALSLSLPSFFPTTGFYVQNINSNLKRISFRSASNISSSTLLLPRQNPSKYPTLASLFSLASSPASYIILRAFPQFMNVAFLFREGETLRKYCLLLFIP